MSQVTEIDIAIIGGGSAGMTLASKLAASTYSSTAVVFEPKTPLERDCCWSLWSTPQQRRQLNAAIIGGWDKWRLIDNSGEVILDSKIYEYTCLSSAKYLQSCEDSLNNYVKLKRSSIDQVGIANNKGEISADGMRYSAETIFDSRLPPLRDNSLRQHFLGWEIRTQKAMTELDIATLMDFRVDQSRGLHFIYALPFSENHLMLESTMISKKLENKQWYRDAMVSWLGKQGIEIAELVREEIGVIPMEEIDQIKSKKLSIGAASGAVRMSSGYAFNSIQEQMTGLVNNIGRGEISVPQPIPSYLTKIDEIFNGVLLANPELAVDIFMRTAKALNGDQFASFMIGSAGIKEWSKIIFSMPKIPFLRQLWHLMVEKW